MSTPQSAAKTTTTTTTTKVVKTVGSTPKKATGVAGEKKQINSHKNQRLSTVGLMKFSRGRMFHRRAIWRIGKWKEEQTKLKETQKKTKRSSAKRKEPAMKKKAIGGERNGKERSVRSKRFPRYYPTEERPKKFRVKRKRFSQHERRFRSNLTPGTIVIMVAGRYAGKRAVIVKQLKSGLLLLTGPHKLNGVPLRRMNQIYVIGTSTKLDLTNAKLDHLDDKVFKRAKKQKKNAENAIFDTKKELALIKGPI
ncbi:unnamed protein product [Didymodactylos carnosus]|uniref:Large ribosomal subunit protein eL6 n=1 Tax=Didymodactylos carnosus TaxID=1234261 RepID=A0A8S2RF46_9BILA|nr:unnamed protein product [Didymodactylos carnosus]CAF4156743.1 unnamed protein product [Didymodactylos carnosus]